MTRGFTIVEALVAAFVLLVACVALVTVFGSSLKRSEQSKNRGAAILLAQSMLDEVEDHVYGTKPPNHWPVDEFRVDNPIVTWIHGVRQEDTFHCQLRFQTGGAIGRSSKDTDVVTVIVTWKEEGGAISRDYGLFNDVTYPQDNQKVVASLPLWR